MVRQQLGLDQPLHVQFWHYITNVLRGDFGISMASRRPALPVRLLVALCPRCG